MKNWKEIIETPLAINRELILELITLIDLTTLGNTDTTDTVLNLVDNANKGFQNKHVAAACVFANYGALVKANLKSNIKTAVVGGCFPTGQTLTAAKINEANAIHQLAIDELDIVINRSLFFNEDFETIHKEIKTIKQSIGKTHLKVILETGDLKTAENIKKASEIAIVGGADFIKTSTGKTSIGATPEAVYVMCNVIKTHFKNTGIKIGIKPSGGIRTLADALIYYKIVKFILGKEWLNNQLFRIGASSLYTNLKEEYNLLH